MTREELAAATALRSVTAEMVRQIEEDGRVPTRKVRFFLLDAMISGWNSDIGMNAQDMTEEQADRELAERRQRPSAAKKVWDKKLEAWNRMSKETP